MAFPGAVEYPINFVNRRGIPLIESRTVDVSDTDVSLIVSDNAFRFLEERGVFLFRLTQVIPENGADLPVLFSWTRFGQTRTQALTLVGGTAVTGSQLSNIGVYLVYYDKSANLLQLMTVGPTAVTNTNTNG